MRIFVGFDERQPLGTYVFLHSLNKFNSDLTCCSLLNEDMLKKKELLPQKWDKDQLTPFGRSRFLVPYLSQYEGWSLFVDGVDMMMRDDIMDLWALRDDKYAIMLVKHVDDDQDFSILGREHKSYKKFNWSSVMLFNNVKCKNLTAEYVFKAPYLDLHQFHWVDAEGKIGELPLRWNHLVGYYPYEEEAALVHWTKGGPHLGEDFKKGDYTEEWMAITSEMLGTLNP